MIYNLAADALATLKPSDRRTTQGCTAESVHFNAINVSVPNFNLLPGCLFPPDDVHLRVEQDFESVPFGRTDKKTNVL